MQRPSPCRPLRAIRRPVLLRLSVDRRHRLFARREWDPFKFDKSEGNAMPYDYDPSELQDFDNLMTPAFESYSLPNSKIELKRLLNKHGVRCDATFETDYDELIGEQEVKKKTPVNTWKEKRFVYDDFLAEEQANEDDDDEAWFEEEISEADAYVMQTAEFGYHCTREAEAEEIFEKAMELHHSQRERSRNLYATCNWYAKKLEMAEMQNTYEIDDPNPIPPYIRAFFTMEEEFEKLNARQIVDEQKYTERVREMEEEEYREFLRSQVVTMPTKPGDKYYDIFAPKDKEEMEKNKKNDEEAEQEEMDADIDVFLHGILPNVRIDKGKPESIVKSKDAFLHELAFKEDEID